MERFYLSLSLSALIIIFMIIFFSDDHVILKVHCTRVVLPILDENGGNATETKVYIVHVSEPNSTDFLQFTDLENWYKSFLPNTTLDSGQPRLVYSYHKVISGFAAKLTEEELKVIESMEGFVYAHQEREYIVHTTHTPKYLKLHQNWDYDLWATANYGAGKIIGVLDTGIDPDHPSFQDNDMPQPPQFPVWKGQCFWPDKCNSKLIGIRAFRQGWAPDPYDHNGHGTHVASTAAGNFVDNAEVLGEAAGRASGMAPMAHLAIYKVLYNNNKGEAQGKEGDILAGIDWAIRDGVHILQMSLGVHSKEMFDSPVAIGSFAAMKEGICPCAAAGNAGPAYGKIANDAPWILTVGASSTDRRIVASVTLGDGMSFDGESGYQPDSFTPQQLPLVFPGLTDTNDNNLLMCNVSLKPFNVKGKLVVCWTGAFEPVDAGEKVKNAGGAGLILVNQWWGSNTTSPEPHVLPVSNVDFDAGEKIISYMKSTANPTASITFKHTQFGTRPSPAVATFSSRGPSKKNYGILKPDIIAPGENILAAWPKKVGPSPTGTYSQFMFLSGTSMATPHVSGIVALLMNLHPNWSPARIKSALMTSSYILNSDGKPIKDEYYKGNVSYYAMGAGHVDPLAAIDPGLVYDLEYYNYVHYLCGTGISDNHISAIIRGAANCSQTNKIPAKKLNYPSFYVKLESSPVTVSRVVTNVGEADSEYHVEIEEPKEATFVVSPTKLQFTKKEETAKFEVTFIATGVLPKPGRTIEGHISWVSPKHVVRSPVVLTLP